MNINIHFALYTVKRLGARRVMIYEPSPWNGGLFRKNIANNAYEDRMEPVNNVVTDVRNAMMKVDAPDRLHTVASDQPLSSIPDVFSGIQNIVFEDHTIGSVWARLESVKRELRRQGYAPRMYRGLISASRS